MPQAVTIQASVSAYLDSVSLSRSPNTARTYRNALQAFLAALENAVGLDPTSYPAEQASEDWIADFVQQLKTYAPTTERLYLTAIAGWYEFLAAERLAAVNLPRLRLLIKRRARRPGQRLPQFPRQNIDKLLDYALRLSEQPSRNPRHRLRLLRDRAFLITLADTGLRVHEACGLLRGQVDWIEGHALLIGKGDRQSLVRFSERALSALRDYLHARAAVDGASGRPLGSLPLFARHDRRAGARVLSMSTTTGRAIVAARSRQALGSAASDPITPHSLRHYFVTTVLRASGGNLRMAQELARHRNIAVTQRYAHLADEELDRGYHEIFNRAN